MFPGRFRNIIMAISGCFYLHFFVLYIFFIPYVQGQSFARRNLHLDYRSLILHSRFQGVWVFGGPSFEVWATQSHLKWTQLDSSPVLSRVSSNESMRTGKSTPRAKVNPMVTIMRTVVQKQINHDQTLSWLYEDIFSQRRPMLAIFTLYFTKAVS